MTGRGPHIHFVLDARSTHWPDIGSLLPEDIARQPHRFVGGRNSWIAQTFVRLRPALQGDDWKVTAGPGFVPGGICVAHRDDANAFRGAAHRSFLVVVRADRAPVAACDLAVAQNALALAPHERFVPLWPQPGLRPRDDSRGTQVRRIAYMGRTPAAPPWFTDANFHAAMKRRGLEFEVRSANWDRYEDVDLVLAARDEAPTLLATKPATKVYNGWLARVPVLAAPEPAYLALRRNPLDFLEIRDAAGVIEAVDRLRGDAALYRAMVMNGVQRAREFSVEATARRWLSLLESEVMPLYRATLPFLDSRRAWYLAAMGWQKILGKEFKAAARIERLRMLPWGPIGTDPRWCNLEGAIDARHWSPPVR